MKNVGHTTRYTADAPTEMVDALWATRVPSWRCRAPVECGCIGDPSVLLVVIPLCGRLTPTQVDLTGFMSNLATCTDVRQMERIGDKCMLFSFQGSLG